MPDHSVLEKSCGMSTPTASELSLLPFPLKVVKDALQELNLLKCSCFGCSRGLGLLLHLANGCCHAFSCCHFASQLFLGTRRLCSQGSALICLHAQSRSCVSLTAARVHNQLCSLSGLALAFLTLSSHAG